ncbi:3-hydroxyisobutyryl-CoA hydrolase [Amylibacter marinus]|uniref:3-hydroxyisobutyryl-CoA hydrolase n=1 Tax=Amylibacter marinus TaxID=1475483 RepID=A0ABQ5VVU8_9RHOB|nr:enoyl-CoA hydratase/isomerase family protein [Amylibacter marinus]GLQ35312.1 3-hydroxyisobutyryl-CoA hydrolase [Amylibacter marinus]
MSHMLTETRGRAGIATLNRPEALNALGHEMCILLEDALRRWAKADDVDLVIVDSVGEKAFCAGGDIKSIYNNALAGESEKAFDFWLDEYRLNATIDTYSKPYVAIMDKIVMGGGVGITAHGSHRIVTERTMLAMPECAIGLLPDVGGTHLLAQVPHDLGLYAGLTGARLSGADCLYAGLADYFVPSDQLPALIEELSTTGDVAVIEKYVTDPGPSDLQSNWSELRDLFGHASVAQIMKACQSSDSALAEAAYKALQNGAPLSLMVTFDAIRTAQGRNTLVDALRLEYRTCRMALNDGEFIEGVRAAVIDKDRNPRWKYATLDSVPATLTAAIHAPAQGGDFQFSPEN